MGVRRAEVVSDFVGKHINCPRIIGIILVAVEDAGVTHPVITVGNTEGIEPSDT